MLSSGCTSPPHKFLYISVQLHLKLSTDFKHDATDFFKGGTYPRSESSQSSFTSGELQRKGETASPPTATNPLDRGRRLNSVYHVCCLIYAEGAGGNSQAGRSIMGQDRDATKFLASSFLLEELFFFWVFPPLKKKKKRSSGSCYGWKRWDTCQVKVPAIITSMSWDVQRGLQCGQLLFTIKGQWVQSVLWLLRDIRFGSLKTHCQIKLH